MPKVIVVSDTVYSELQKMKKDTSFSKMIEALIRVQLVGGNGLHNLYVT